MNEILLSVLGVIGALAGVIKWLLTVYFKQSSELESLKKKFTDTAIQELKSTVEDHKRELRVVKEKLDQAAKGYKSNQEGFKNVTENLRKFVTSNDRELDKIKSQIIKISEELIMIKSVKREDSDN